MEVVYGFAFNLSHAFMYCIFVCLKKFRCFNARRIMWMNEMKYDRLMKFYSTKISNSGREVYHFSGGFLLNFKGDCHKFFLLLFC